VIDLDSDEVTASKPNIKEADKPLNIDYFIVEEEVNVNDLNKFNCDYTCLTKESLQRHKKQVVVLKKQSSVTYVKRHWQQKDCW